MRQANKKYSDKKSKKGDVKTKDKTIVLSFHLLSFKFFFYFNWPSLFLLYTLPFLYPQTPM
jgi:hypothetical protein